MRIKFWKWARDASERLWHWIYYNRIPEGIERRVKSEIARKNGGWISYSFKYATSDGKEFDPSAKIPQ